MRIRFAGRRHAAIAATAVLALGAFTATAVAVLSGSSGGAQTRMDNRGQTDPQATTSVAWVNVTGSEMTIGVPDPSRLINARFTGESRCYGVAGTHCAMRVIAINTATGAVTELDPASGMDFAFDGVTDAIHDESPEDHGFERSRRLGYGTYRIVAQMAVTNASTKFILDDWHFALESSI